MARYILKRLVAGFLSLFMLITITFFLMHSIPGGPFSKGEHRKTPEAVLEQIRDQYGLNDPIYVQYVRYLKNISKGNLGVSFTKLNYSVNDLIVDGAPNSAKVGILAVILAVIIGIALGIISAVRRGHLPDMFAMVIATAGVSIPSFVLCALSLCFFCGKLRILPSFGLNSAACYILPVSCLAFGEIAYITRLTRSSMIETLKQDYIQTERSKGTPEFVVITKYTLKNSILPVITYLGPMFASIITGTFVIEKTFSIPGLGRYFVEAIGQRDYAITLGLTIFVGSMIIICNLVVDIIYALVDPRIRIDA